MFNKTCWTKANNLLKEILQGYYSDPPGIELYSLKKKPGTRIVIYDTKLNLPLLDCKRDTNGLESKHGRMNYTAGKRSMGLEYGDHVLAERRFRATIDASKKNRLDFPHIHHYSPWLMDILQMRVESKHDVLLYPSWVNISVLSLQTKERFGLVEECSCVLDEAKRSDAWDLAVAELTTQVLLILYCPIEDRTLEGLRKYLMLMGISC